MKTPDPETFDLLENLRNRLSVLAERLSWPEKYGLLEGAHLMELWQDINEHLAKLRGEEPIFRPEGYP